MARVLAGGVALLSLAACSPKPVEPAPVVNPPNLAENAYPPRGWAWAEIPGQEPARRYGVASPARVPRAEVLILPERAPAEAWYPTVNALVEHGYTVWLADPQPAPLRTAAAQAMIDSVIRKGASGRLLILGEGRGAVAAFSSAEKAKGVVLWSPVAGSAPASAPEAGLLSSLKLGGLKVLRPKPRDGGVPASDALAQAWIKANPTLKPAKPTYGGLHGYELDRRALNTGAVLAARKAVPVWIAGGDAAAKADCQALTSCKTVAPGVEVTIAVFDELTKDVSLGAPPPPSGRKHAPVRKPNPA